MFISRDFFIDEILGKGQYDKVFLPLPLFYRNGLKLEYNGKFI